jgi:coenzyme F420-reducing hydrogenase beta subunit
MHEKEIRKLLEANRVVIDPIDDRSIQHIAASLGLICIENIESRAIIRSNDE